MNGKKKHVIHVLESVESDFKRLVSKGAGTALKSSVFWQAKKS
jgi:hypothetical protein